MSVYFAKSCGYIKIGYAKDPIERASTLTTSGTRPTDLPRRSPVTLLGWVPGDYWAEGAFHARFVEQRVRGEWFTLSPADVVPLIWADPRGVDVQRMSFQAVVLMHRQPHLTRDQLAQAGVRVIGATETEVLDFFDREVCVR